MDPITQQILSGHTQSINELNAGLLALVEIVRDADLADLERFGKLRSKYLAQIEQKAAELRDQALGKRPTDGNRPTDGDAP